MIKNVKKGIVETGTCHLFGKGKNYDSISTSHHLSNQKVSREKKQRKRHTSILGLTVTSKEMCKLQPYLLLGLRRLFSNRV